MGVEPFIPLAMKTLPSALVTDVMSARASKNKEGIYILLFNRHLILKHRIFFQVFLRTNSH